MKQALLFLLLTLPVMAQVSFTGADYGQNFDGMGTGTAAPRVSFAECRAPALPEYPAT